MDSFILFLSRHPAVGVPVTVIAVIAFVVWDYIRTRGGSWQLTYLPVVRFVAIAACFLSLVLMTSRFFAVWFL